MEIQQIKKTVLRLLNESRSEIQNQFTEIIDENLGSTLYSVSGLIEEVIEGIDEMGFEEDEWGSYPSLKVSDVEEIFSQVC